MAGPRSSTATLFYRCSVQRFEEAQGLLNAGKTTGAVYLAGYGVECALKALVLAATPQTAVADVEGTFRGRQAHDFRWLRARYRERGGAALPAGVARQFTLVGHWSTELRYLPRSYKGAEARRFLTAAIGIIEWAQGRL